MKKIRKKRRLRKTKDYVEEKKKIIKKKNMKKPLGVANLE
jgi:hypothetical protein